jgi:hypothetical protein
MLEKLSVGTLVELSKLVTGNLYVRWLRSIKQKPGKLHVWGREGGRLDRPGQENVSGFHLLDG